jgi:hypothetical protein
VILCSSPACKAKGTADDPAPTCLYPTWVAGAGGYEDPSCINQFGSGQCEGRCSKTSGTCPTSSCAVNRLGSEENNCPHSANCPVNGIASCQLLAPNCEGQYCLGRVHCNAGEDCGIWEGVTCFTTGRSSSSNNSSNNSSGSKEGGNSTSHGSFKICSSPECSGGPLAQESDAPPYCTYPVYKGTPLAALDTPLLPGSCPSNCTGGCIGGCCASTGQCPSSSCLGNELGLEERSCPKGTRCPLREQVSLS